MQIVAALILLAAHPPIPAEIPADIGTGLPAAAWVGGWCRTAVRTGPPPGLMYLAIGLVAGGAAGWGPERKAR